MQEENKDLHSDETIEKNVEEAIDKTTESVESVPAAAKPKASMPKPLIFGIIAAVVVVALACVLLLLPKGGNDDNGGGIADGGSQVPDGDENPGGGSHDGEISGGNTQGGGNTSDTPDIPDVPETPNIPDEPDTPDVPDNPTPPSHSHSYTEEIAESRYLASNASCGAAAKYYYSCECGEKGSQTFTYGHPSSHYINSYGSCDRCGYASPYHTAVYEENERHENELDNIDYEVESLGRQEERLENQLYNYGIYSLSSLSSSNYYYQRMNTLSNSISNKRSQMYSYQASGDYSNANRLQREIDDLEDEYIDCKVLYGFACDKEEINRSYSFWREERQNENAYHQNRLNQLEAEYYEINRMINNGHINFSNKWTVTAEASCTKNGTEIYKCDFCDYYISQSISKLGHDLLDPDCINPSKCSRCSYTEGVCLGHDWVDATCVEDGYCNRCNIKGDSKLGHDYVSHGAKSNNCTEIGWEAYDTCSRCDYTTYVEIAATGHDCPEGWTITREAFYYSPGERIGVCTTCGSIAEDIPAPAESQGLKYHEYNGGIYIDGIGDCTDTRIIIPKQIDGLNVIGISSEAFKNLSSITAMIIPSTVTYIGNSAFAGCTSLEELGLPTASSCVGTYYSSITPYFKVSSYNTHDDIPSSLTKIIIFSGTSIPYRAFYNLSSITEVVLSDTITQIGEEAFSGCSITNLVLPAHIESIGAQAFSGATTTDLYIPETLTSLGNYRPLGNVTGGVYISSLEAWCNISFGPYNSNPLETAGGLYLNNELVETLVIPDNVKAIPSNAFSGCSSIKTVVLHENVVGIGQYAFKNCTALEGVTMKGKGTWVLSGAYEDNILISSTSLTSPATNASYLKNTYGYYSWRLVVGQYNVCSRCDGSGRVFHDYRPSTCSSCGGDGLV